MKKNILLSFVLVLFASVAFTQENIEFKEFYYANKNKEPITELDPNSKIIYLVVVTTNGKGKSVTIELDEGDPDVIYKKKHYGVGDKFELVLKDDTEYIKFRVFDMSKKKHRKLANIEDAR